ncbi:PAS domain-containing protein [Streptomyces sp. NPDC001719]
MSSRPSRGAARLAAILDALPDALLLVNCNGTVVNANHIALETFEVPGTGLVGRGLLSLLPDFDSRRIPGSMRLPDSDDGRTKPTRMIARRTDGSQFPVEVTSANLEDGRTPYADHKSYTGDELLMLVVRDLTGTLDTEAELARQQRQTEMILRAAAEGVVGVDTEGRVVLVNPSAAQILGYRASDLGGQELHPLIHHSRGDGTPFPYEESPIADTLRSGRKHRVRGQVLWAKDGRAVPVDLTTAPVRDGDQLVGAVMTFTDRRPYDALAARHAQLLAVLDSSLRGPLEQLRGELGTLADDPAGQLWPEANQILHHLSAGYARMSTLVDNVLAYQRLDAGETKLARKTVPLDEVVAAGVEGAIELIGPGRAQFAVHAPAIEAEIDPERFAQALAHLIADVAGVDATGNAMRSPASSGDSTIVVAAAQRGEVVRIEVRGPFAGGDPVHGPIVRGIVRGHGGVLQAHDMPGAGGNAYVLEVPVSAANGPVTGTPERPVTDAMNATTVMPVPAQRARGTAERPDEPQPTGRRRARPAIDEESPATDGAGLAPTGRRARREQRPAEAEAPRTAFALPPAEADRTPEPTAPTGRRARRAATETPERLPIPGQTNAEPVAPRTAFALPPAPSPTEEKDAPAAAPDGTPHQGRPGPFPVQGGTQGGGGTAPQEAAGGTAAFLGDENRAGAGSDGNPNAGGAGSTPDGNPARPGDGAAPYAPAGGTAAFLGDANHGGATGGSTPDGTPNPGWPAPATGAPQQDQGDNSAQRGPAPQNAVGGTAAFLGDESRAGTGTEGNANPAAAPLPPGGWPAPGAPQPGGTAAFLGDPNQQPAAGSASRPGSNSPLAGDAPHQGRTGQPGAPQQGGGTAAFPGDPNHGPTTGSAPGNASTTGAPPQGGGTAAFLGDPSHGPTTGGSTPDGTPNAGSAPTTGAPQQDRTGRPLPAQGGNGAQPGPAPQNTAGGTAAFLGDESRAGTGSAPDGTPNPAPPGGWPAPGNAQQGGAAAFLGEPNQQPAASGTSRPAGSAPSASDAPHQGRTGQPGAPQQGGGTAAFPGNPGPTTGSTPGGTPARPGDGAAPYAPAGGTPAFPGNPAQQPATGNANRPDGNPNPTGAPGGWPAPGNAVGGPNAGGTAAFLADGQGSGAGGPQNHPARTATGWPAPGEDTASQDAVGGPNAIRPGLAQSRPARGATRTQVRPGDADGSPAAFPGDPNQQPIAGAAPGGAGDAQNHPAGSPAGWPAPGGTPASPGDPNQQPAAGNAGRPGSVPDGNPNPGGAAAGTGTPQNHPARPATGWPAPGSAPGDGAPARHGDAPAGNSGQDAGRPGGSDNPQHHHAAPAAGAPQNHPTRGTPRPGEEAAPADATRPANQQAEGEDPTPPTGRRRARRALAEEPGAAPKAAAATGPISVRMLGQGPDTTPPGGTPVGSGRRRKLGNPSEEERQTPTPSAATPRPQTPGTPQGRTFAIGAPDDGAEGPEPLDGPNSAVEVVNTPRPPMDDELPPEPLDNPRRLLVWPAPDDSTRTALTERGYRPVIVHSREEVDAQIAAYPAALFVDPLTGPITRTALQSLREAAIAAEVPVLVTAGLGQAAKEAAYGADPAVLLKALAPRDSEMHPSRVLLIEEHAPIAEALTATLERRGMQVAHATGDADAVTLAAELRPNLVVMDLMQVRRRRAGIVDWLRGNGLLARTPLVVYTSAGMDPTQLALLAAGETVLFLAERSTSAEVQGRIVDLLSKLG